MVRLISWSIDVDSEIDYQSQGNNTPEEKKWSPETS